MARHAPPVDAVIIGYGWTGAIMAKTLTDAGLSVVALERGPARDTSPDFEYPRIVERTPINPAHPCKGLDKAFNRRLGG